VRARGKKLIRGHSNGSEWIGSGAEWIGMPGMARNARIVFSPLYFIS
jgi:hypothetical protein